MWCHFGINATSKKSHNILGWLCCHLVVIFIHTLSPLNRLTTRHATERHCHPCLSSFTSWNTLCGSYMDGERSWSSPAVNTQCNLSNGKQAEKHTTIPANGKAAFNNAAVKTQFLLLLQPWWVEADGREIAGEKSLHSTRVQTCWTVCTGTHTTANKQPNRGQCVSLCRQSLLHFRDRVTVRVKQEQKGEPRCFWWQEIVIIKQ